MSSSLEGANGTVYSTKDNKLPSILLSTILTSILLGFLLLFGPLRRFTTSTFCNLCLFGSYMVVPSLINNILGKIDPDSLPEDSDPMLLSVMAVYLLILYAGQDNINALSIKDNEDHKRYTIEFIVMNAFFISLLPQSHQFFWPIILLWLAMFLKLQERKWAFFCASKSGIAQVCLVVADYMKSEHIDHETERINDYNPVNLTGYKYLVDVPTNKHHIVSPSCQMKVRLEKAVTLDKVWHCEGQLLSLEDKNGYLKDLCLSSSLFWLLLRRFAGFTLHELTIKEAREKTWKLVREGLLLKEGKDQVERVFSVIEMELMFLYDYIYTKYYIVFSGGVLHFFKRCFVFLTIVSISIWVNSKADGFLKINPISKVLYLLVIMVIVLELKQVFVRLTSKWFIVKIICHYVRLELWKSTYMGYYAEKIIKVLTFVPRHNFIPAWRRKLGQYSLLENYGYNPTTYRFARLSISTLIDIPRPGQKENKSIKLSYDVKEALFSSIRNMKDSTPTNGVTSLQKNDVELLSWACRLESSAHVILVWHIATSYCEMKLTTKPKKTDSFYKNFKVAKDLSMYCAYLVAFAPELLRDHIRVTKAVFDQVIVESNKFFAKVGGCINCCKDLTGRKINEMDKVKDENYTQKDNNIARGVLLGKQLMSRIHNNDKRWKFLAEFWAELILFLAPSNHHTGHAQHLVKGGELMTILWALLNHAGVTWIEDDYHKPLNGVDVV